MRDLNSLKKRLADQSKSRASLNERARKIKERHAAKQKISKLRASPHSSIQPVDQPKQQVQERIHAGDTFIHLKAKLTDKAIAPQPWTIELVDTLLAAADQRCTTLCLIWPAKLTSLPIIHALANLERQFARDLRGIRTLLYPATHALRAPLNHVLVEKIQLSELYRSLWSIREGSSNVVSKTSSQAFIAALSAINKVRILHPELSNPSLAELVPTFVFEPTQHEWVTPLTNPLERTLSKVEPLSNRRTIRQEVDSEWGFSNKAPGALLALHHTVKKESWRNALKTAALKKPNSPEAILFDATDASAKTNYSAVKKIPEYLKFAHESGLSDCGSVIVTDDPKTFFIFRAQLNESKFAFSTKVLAAEAADALLSAHPEASNWAPAQRSNSNFNVHIVDRDASQIAVSFQHLMACTGCDGTPAHNALLQASLYVLRLSNVPAGYLDLTSQSAGNEDEKYNNRRNAWTPIKLDLLNALASGELNGSRESVERAIARAERLIDDWNDATPMAARMLAEVKKHMGTHCQGLSFVLPNNSYILLANHFLQRKLGDEWAEIVLNIKWHTLETVYNVLTEDTKNKHFVFIGVNPNVIRVLLTHPGIPHRTVVLLAYRQADSTLKTLSRMKEIEVFKAYRGRIGLLTQALERRLNEIPNPVNINKISEMQMLFKFEDKRVEGQNTDTPCFIFELEGNLCTSASGWVYRYIDDDESTFRRTAASTIQRGDFIFNMSDELRTKLESLLLPGEEAMTSVVEPVRMLLKLYHDDVMRRCTLMFKSSKRSALAREIHSKMVELDPTAAECRIGRVYYWLAPLNKDNKRPHASRDAIYFRIFCKALGISEDVAQQHWNFIKNARNLNQSLGRELLARYSEILFQPESATIYRKVPEEILLELQTDAFRCVFRVERVIPPSMALSNKEPTNVHS
ncbi:hypothetical protein [Klebsiella grimontii]|uniref:hypothetical protein n=5 Tax=Klebsiella grimontii TaxID=2058152 RepID=UPI0015AAC59E|nr:hypothetical protein [Klebsiella grimontii]